MDFEDFLSDLNLKSTWRSDIDLVEGEAQTDQIDYRYGESQTEEGEDVDCQTEPQRDLEFLKDESPQFKAFLSRAGELMEVELERNLTSTAFHGYEVRWEEAVDSITCIAEFRPEGEEEQLTKLACTGISWSRGGLLGACFGRMDHTGWCNHAGIVCVWSVFRSVVASRCLHTVETQSCVTSCSFHPEREDILAVGCFNGEILLLSLDHSSEECMVAKTDLNSDLSHREPVTSLSWVPLTSSPMEKGKGGAKDVLGIASTSGDGKVLLWDVGSPSSPSLQVVTSLILGGGMSGKHVSSSSSSSNRESFAAAPGATSISFSAFDSSHFVAGTEGGKVLKCSVSADLASPVLFPYEPHSGPVHKVSFSPFHRNLFLTARSLLSLVCSEFPLFDVSWSPFRPMIFTVASGDGRMYIFDLCESQTSSVVQVRVDSPRFPTSVQAVAFNPRANGYVATGDGLAVVKVWELSLPLVRIQERDRKLMTFFGEIRKSQKER